MDIRYNVINWVHRSTRGWSSGASVTDPRTGEIIKAVVTLGSLRVRQDYLIFEGLLSPYENGTERPAILAEAALARLRQLSAHEIGHTLGLSHNFYASSGGRISVMDYPHALEILREDGSIDLSEAYDVGIGEWDKVAIEYGYQHFPEGVDEPEALGSILNEAWQRDLRFMSNQDMAVSPKSDWWNNNDDVVAGLEHLMAVRRSALDRMGESTIRLEAPMATIEEALVPIYLYHRWGVQSVASILGGQDYVYSLRGDGRLPFERPSGARQRQALELLASTLSPKQLAIPESIIERLPPRPSGYGFHRELFPRTTGSTFDVLTPPTIASDITIGFMLEPDRAARIVEQHLLNPDLPLSRGSDRSTDRGYLRRYGRQTLRAGDSPRLAAGPDRPSGVGSPEAHRWRRCERSLSSGSSFCASDSARSQLTLNPARRISGCWQPKSPVSSNGRPRPLLRSTPRGLHPVPRSAISAGTGWCLPHGSARASSFEGRRSPLGSHSGMGEPPRL